MRFKYLTNSSGFTRSPRRVGQLLDGATDGYIEELSQHLRPDPASRCLNRPCELRANLCRELSPLSTAARTTDRKHV